MEQAAVLHPGRFGTLYAAVIGDRLWLALLGVWGAACALTSVQSIVAAPSPAFIEGGLAFLVAALAMRSLFEHDRSPALVLEGFGALAISITVTAPLSYVATRSPFPAVDGALAWLDHAIGFDAARARATVFNSPVLHKAFSFAYGSYLAQYLLALVVLPRTPHPRRGLELISLSVLTLCLSFVVVFLFPTIGTMPELEPWATAWHRLHDNRRIFDPAGAILPIVSLPSFHAAMAVLLSYCLRGLGLLSRIAMVLDAAMLVATPVMGFHHIADVIAGMAVAAISILMLSHSRRQPRVVAAVTMPPEMPSF